MHAIWTIEFTSEREGEVSESVLSVQQSCLCAWLGRCGSFCCLSSLHCSRWGPYVINFVTTGWFSSSTIHSKKPMMSGGWHHFHPRPAIKTCEISSSEPRQAFRKLMSAQSWFHSVHHHESKVWTICSAPTLSAVNGSNQESNYAYSQ